MNISFNNFVLCFCIFTQDIFRFRLRLGLLNEEMRDSELGSQGDDMFNDVVRDFSQMAYNHPERLVRKYDEK